MSNATPIPAVVSKRNEFTPADEFVENNLPYLPQEFQHVNFRKWLLEYTERVIRGVAHHFGTAAERGIEQAANLLCDPDFYETKRQRRAKWRKDMKDQEAKQEFDRMERKLCPTAEQIAQDIKWAKQQLAYHEDGVEKCSATLAHLHSLNPKNIRLMPKSVQ
jgi:hypothetical protein